MAVLTNYMYLIVSAIITHRHTRTELITLKNQTVFKMFNMVFFEKEGSTNLNIA